MKKNERSGAALNRHRSNQTYSTPHDFMSAVIKRFGVIVFDLAASKENAKSPSFFSEKQNSLVQDWDRIGRGSPLHGGNLWLNPPYNDIEPWARKCSLSKQRILFLTPASIGSNWFQQHVHGRALVLALNPRLSFDLRHPYPKDLILSAFNYSRIGFEVWRWK